ncbi:uncharacterized protein LOC144097701 [Amblyomma americanum]
MTLPTVARTADRDALADPTPPILNVPVWALLLIFLVLLSIVMAFLDMASHRMRGNRAAASESWKEYFWMLFENMLCEASAVAPERAVLRIVSAAWWLAIVVLMNAFSGQMRACLLLKTELERINTLQDIAARPHLKVYLLKNTVPTRYLESSQGAVEKKVWSMIRRDKSDLNGLLHFPEEMLYEIIQEKAVVIHANTVSQTEAGKFCSGGEIGEFYFGTESMYSLLFGAYINRHVNATLRKRIKRITTALFEAGIVYHTYDMALPPLDRCLNVEGKEEDLTLGDMGSVFYVYCAFTAASILVFMAEMIAGYFTRREGRSPRLSQVRRAPRL